MPTRLKKGQYEVIFNDEYCIAEISIFETEFDDEFTIIHLKDESGEEIEHSMYDDDIIRKQIRTQEMSR